MTATVTGICLKDIVISLQWGSSDGQAHRYILYTYFSNNAYIFTWWRTCTSALLYSVNINYETLIKLHIHLRTGPGTHMFVFVIIFEVCNTIVLCLSLCVYCLFIYFMVKTNIKFHILSFGIYALWNFLRPDWILVFGQKSLVQWENNTHKHTYIELIARLRTKKDDMTIKKIKLKISMLMQTTYFWNNHHQVYSQN